MNLLIKNANIIDAYENFNGDILIIDGKISEIVPEVDPAGSKVEELENIENMENVENIETDETDIAVDEEANVETEEVSDVKESVVENTTVASENTVETETNGQENGQMEQKETKKSDELSTDDSVNVNAVRPEDFAARLTEDLSAKVGERQAITIVRQVVEQVSMQTKQGMTTMELQLYPAHLGRVVVQLVSKDGHVTAQIAAESEAAKNALESQLTLLKENLNNQGVKIENVEVTIASHAFEQNMQGERNSEEQSGSKSRGRRAAQILGQNMAMEVEEAPEIMEVMGNTVSYSA